MAEAAGPTSCSLSTVLYVGGILAFFSQRRPHSSSTWKKMLPQPPALSPPKEAIFQDIFTGIAGRTVLSRKLLTPVKWVTCLHAQGSQVDTSQPPAEKVGFQLHSPGHRPAGPTGTGHVGRRARRHCLPLSHPKKLLPSSQHHCGCF